MDGVIEVPVLHRLVYNALLFSNRHSALKGDVLWVQGDGSLRVVSTDEYVVLVDTAEVSHFGPPTYCRSSQAELKKMEKNLRDETGDAYIPALNLQEAPDDDITEMLQHGDSVVGLIEHLNEATSKTFAAHPDRFRKLALVKPQTYPIDFRLFEAEDDAKRLMLGFRIGPTVRGVISSLDRKILQQQYDGEELWQ